MVTEDIDGGIVKLEKKRSHLVKLMNSLNKVKNEQVDLQADCDAMINKVKVKLSTTDKQLKELCDYAVEIALAEADAYEAAYQTDSYINADTDNNIFM